MNRHTKRAFALGLLGALLAAAAPGGEAGEAGGGRPRIDLAREVYASGETVGVKLVGQAAPYDLRLRDCHGRVLDRIRVVASVDGFEPGLKLGGVVTSGATVELVSGGKVVARRAVLVRTGERLGARYRVIANAWGREMTDEACAALRRAGVRIALADSRETARRLAAHGVSVVMGEAAGAGLLRSSPAEGGGPAAGGARNRCLGSPFFRREVDRSVGELHSKCEGLPLAGVVAVRGPSMGVSYEPHGLCRSTNCLTAFAEHLRRRHGSLHGLSKSWGGVRRSWRAAAPESELVTRARLGTKGVLAPNATIAPWLEHRLFCDCRLAEAAGGAAEAIRRAFGDLPVAVLGAEAPSGYGPPALPELLSHFEVAGALTGSVPNQFASSFCPGRGRSLGSPADAEIGLLSGEVGVLASPDAFADAGRIPRGVRSALELQGAVGELFMEATPGRSRVSLLVSDESAKASYLLDRWLSPRSKPPLGQYGAISQTSYMGSLSGWVELLDDLGVEYNFVIPESVARGALRTGRTQLLVLARSIAMSERTARAVEAFCRRGGVVVADAAPGIFDDSGRRRNLLDDLFGVCHGALEFSERGLRVLPVVRGPVIFARPDSPDRRAYPRASLSGFPVAVKGVTAKAGTANAMVADAPCLIRSRFGEGTAYYLNLAVSRYPRQRKTSAQGLRRIARFVLVYAGARPPVKVHAAGGDELFGIRRWELGRLSVYGIWRRTPGRAAGDLRVAIGLPEAAYISEPRRGLRHGLRSDIETTVPAKGVLVIVVSPVEQKRVTLGLMGAREPLDFEVGVEMADGQRPGVRAVRVWAESPSLERPPWYDRVVFVKGAPATGKIPFCLSDERGPWKIRARDIATGRETFRTYLLK